MSRSDIIDLVVVFRREAPSGLAVLVECLESGESVWLPLSKIEIEDGLTEGSYCEVSLPMWLAEEKGLA